MIENPVVFISYSQDSNEHKKWVNKLATDLRSHGVDAILDQWDLRLGQDLRFFMEQGLSKSSLVLCICSEKYVDKVNNGTGGAGYEGMVMTQSLLSNCNQEYVIPIVRNNFGKDKVPYAFGSKKYIDFTEDAEYYSKYKELIERIYGEDTLKKPPLGQNPFSVQLSTKIAEKRALEKIKYNNPSTDGHIIFEYDNNNHRYILGSGEYQFETRWSGCATDAIYAYGKVGYKKEYVSFPKLEEILDFDFSSSTRTVRKGEIIIFENDYAHFVAIKMGSVLSRSHGAADDIMEFDYHIYTTE